jgi:hypothetical protein
MEKDFHYCMIRVLAEKSGFTPEEAQILAYASQYVDDAVRYQEIRIEGMPEDKINYPRLKDDVYFDPVCTAHKGIQFIASVTKDAQRKVYIPFHFIPAVEYGGAEGYDYRVVPNSSFANNIVNIANGELKNSKEDERIQRLIKLGISLHLFADTWSHQRFSGRHGFKDNNVEEIRLFNNGRWKALSSFKNLILNALSDIGHAEALTYPDLSHQKWKYKQKRADEYERDNTIIFHEAAKTINELLCKAAGKSSDWDKYADKVKECLALPADSADKKFANYKKIFPEINLNYDEDEWMALALKGGTLVSDENGYNLMKYEFNGDLKWFYFHIEAFKQREYVMKNIKMDLH